MLLIVDVLSYVLSAICPGEGASSVHLVIAPLALILSAIGPGVDSLAVNVVIVEFTDVH
jgi:hypothetical protein